MKKTLCWLIAALSMVAFSYIAFAQAPVTILPQYGNLQSRIASLATNNSTLVATGVRQLTAIHVGNSRANIIYIKFYNKATAPTCGTDTPIATMPLAANGGRIDNDFIYLDVNLGLGYCIVTGSADSDNTAVAAGDLMGFINFK